MRMNLYWSDSPMSWLRHMTIVSFQKLHPDAEVVLWSSPRVMEQTWTTGQAHENYTGKDWREELSGVTFREYAPPLPMPPQHTGDMCRWEVLADGGMYSDMDVLFCREVYLPDADALSCENGVLRLGVASGAKGGFFADVLASAIDGYDPRSYQSMGVEAIYRMVGLDVKTAAGRDTIGMLLETTGKQIAHIPMERFHPFSPDDVFTTRSLPKYAAGVHWYGGHHQSVEMSRDMTPDNWHSYDNAISAALRHLSSKGAL